MAGDPQTSCTARGGRRASCAASERTLAWYVALASIALGSCIGGPHPIPPGDGESGGLGPRAATTAAENTKGGDADQGQAAGSATPPPAAAPVAPVPMMPAPAPAATPAMGPAMNGAAGAGGMGGSGGTGGGPSPTGTVCDGPTAPLAATSANTASNVMLVLDRSVALSGDFAGQARAQLASQSLEHVLSARATTLTVGALLYPSPLPTMCEVNPLASADQIAFQPAAQAIPKLLGGTYAPVATPGVPLIESVRHADSALSAQVLNGPTTVVILATAAPTCGWDSAEAQATVARWLSERGVKTHVVVLPGSAGDTAASLSALASAGGSSRVQSPMAAGALEAALQSIVFDSLSSCVLQLDPPAADPNRVELLVTEAGVERSLPRIGPSGELLWSISPDGRTVTLAGSACSAATSGGYDAVRVVVTCQPR